MIHIRNAVIRKPVPAFLLIAAVIALMIAPYAYNIGAASSRDGTFAESAANVALIG